MDSSAISKMPIASGMFSEKLSRQNLTLQTFVYAILNPLH